MIDELRAALDAVVAKARDSAPHMLPELEALNAKAAPVIEVAAARAAPVAGEAVVVGARLGATSLEAFLTAEAAPYLGPAAPARRPSATSSPRTSPRPNPLTLERPMTRTLRAGALALACVAAAACSTVKAPTTFDTASARLSTETAYDASLLGLEQSIKAGSLTGKAADDARTSLLASYAVLIAGRGAFAASGAAPSAALLTAQAAVDRDYPRVVAELPPPS